MRAIIVFPYVNYKMFVDIPFVCQLKCLFSIKQMFH